MANRTFEGRCKECGAHEMQFIDEIWDDKSRTIKYKCSYCGTVGKLKCGYDRMRWTYTQMAA